MELRGFDDSPEKEARGSQPLEQQQRQRQDEQYRQEPQHRQEQHRQEQQHGSRKLKEQQVEEKKRAECKCIKGSLWGVHHIQWGSEIQMY